MKLNNPIIISIESMKGGVGKTSTGVNLAKKLLNKGYEVLFLDLDITGTNIADSQGGIPYWDNSITHILKIKDENMNLLNLFGRKFMCGFETNTLIKDNIQKGKINVIGSQLHDDIGVIYEPSVLFDELHGFWLMEFLQAISESFVRYAGTDKSPVAIILDNSTGYVGAVPFIEDWLTDLSPNNGKFITVTSSNYSSLDATNSSIMRLRNLYENKWNASKKVYGEDKDLTMNHLEKNFFIELVEKTGRSINKFKLDLSGKELEFYVEKGSGRTETPSGNDYVKHPNKFIGGVIEIEKDLNRILIDWGI